MIDKEELRALAELFHVKLDQTALDRFDCYAAALVEWNQKVNLTAITDPRGIVVKHFADSLSLLGYLQIEPGAKLIDVGTGAGFPGLALLIARPDLDLTLLDGTAKKLRVLDNIIERLGLQAALCHARAEEAGHAPMLREQFDVVTARAVADLRILAEYCLPFAKSGGVWAAMKGARAQEELNAAKSAIRLLGGKTERSERFLLEEAGERTIVFVRKCSPVSEKYPRPSAKIAKLPLE